MPTLSEERAQRVVANDPILAPLIEAPDEVSRGRALEQILFAVAHPLVRSIMTKARSTVLRYDDADDVAATIDLRLVRRLQRLALFEDDAVASLIDFVAALTYHTIYDVLRRRYPERARLKNRVRYILTHNPRLAMWNTHTGAVAGLRECSGRAPRRAALDKRHASPQMLTANLPSDALEAILHALGAPILVDDLVALAADLWDVVDRVVPERHAAAVDPAVLPDVRLESRQYLEALWDEIRALRPPQRAALLFHVRDADGTSALALLVLLGIASFHQVAEVLEMSAERLAALWHDLPLDDLAIAAALGLTRQQVINLRKAARARLSRRMARAEGERRS